MKIDKQEHKKKMLSILADMSADPVLSVNLGFKGGTACYFVHGLNRFSVDLDFDLLEGGDREKVLARLDKILLNYGEIKMEGAIFSRKVKYDEKASSLKIDVSDRVKENSLNKYKVRDIVSGIPLQILKKEDIFAHKLIALKERYDLKTDKKIANRDLYDINFFFKKGWRFNEEIVKLRSGEEAIKYLGTLRKFIESKVDNEKILNGLGGLVDDKQRQWIKKNLKDTVLVQLAIEIEAMRER
jgi:predicted nucleotidyltransferase component of viral defense system